MKALISFTLLLLGSLFIGMTVQDSIIGNSIVKILAALCYIGFWRMIPKNKKLY